METSVDLPAPFSPSRPSTSPAASCSVIASLATSAPKRLPMPSMRSTGAAPLPCIRLLRGGFGLGVVHLDGELAVQDRLLLGLHLGHHVGRNLLLEGAQRRQLGALELHRGEVAVV